MADYEIKQYKVYFKPSAEKDYLGIYAYIANKLSAEPAASRIIRLIQTKIRNLEYFPYAYPLSTTYRLKTKSVRKMVVAKYLVFYAVKESQKEVEILRIVHSLVNY